MLGYEQLGSKRALLCSLADGEALAPDAAWFVLDEVDRHVLHGTLVPMPVSYGMLLWECDFSALQAEGIYRLHVCLGGGETLISDPFKVASRLFLKTTLLPLTTQNAQARLAVHHKSGGYYDCNSMMGEAYSHGIFLNALVQMLHYQGPYLSASDRDALADYAQVAFSYLLSLWDPETALLHNAAPDRPFDPHNIGIGDTQEGLYGITAYLHWIEEPHPDVYEKAGKSLLALEDAHARKDFNHYGQGECLIVCCCRLYQISGELRWKEKAIIYLEAMLNAPLPQVANRSCRRGIPLWEGALMMMRTFPQEAADRGWLAKIMHIKEEYLEILDRCAFHILPIAPQLWEDTRMPPPEGTWLANAFRMTSALDACFLGMMTGDRRMEYIAAGELAYMTGLNFGMPADRVSAPRPDGKPQTAAFIYRLPARHAKAWSTWYFNMPDTNWMTIVNGYKYVNGQFTYVDDWPTAETFIKTDGLFVYAACVYERWLNGS